MFRLIPDTNINFIGVRRIAFGLSAILVALGIFSVVMIALDKAPMGIDFAGGVMIQGHFDSDVAIDDVRSALTGKFENVQVTRVSSEKFPHSFIIKTKSPDDEEVGKMQAAKIKETLQGAFTAGNFTLDSEHIIGPTVGKTLKKDATYAVILSLIGIIIYIWIRFDFRSGIAATVATFHDVLAVLGICYLFGVEFDLLIVTALLTLAGYSLTDTVVVFDRIRENLKKFRSRGEYVFAVNKSINETLGRTVNTSMTVLFVLLVLYLFGGEVLRTFSLSLLLGVIIGSYSSVFVASPIVVEWEAHSPSRFK